MYTGRIEFTSIGGLMNGVTLKDVTMGISVCRNVKLANVFYRLELIEAYGTGIPSSQGMEINHLFLRGPNVVLPVGNRRMSRLLTLLLFYKGSRNSL